MCSIIVALKFFKKKEDKCLVNYSFFQIFIITTAKKFYNGPFKLNLIPKTNGGCCILKTLKRNKIKDQSGNFIKYCFFT